MAREPPACPSITGSHGWLRRCCSRCSRVLPPALSWGVATRRDGSEQHLHHLNLPPSPLSLLYKNCWPCSQVRACRKDLELLVQPGDEQSRFGRSRSSMGTPRMTSPLPHEAPSAQAQTLAHQPSCRACCPMHPADPTVLHSPSGGQGETSG